jgi:putative DNA primase/helicase
MDAFDTIRSPESFPAELLALPRWACWRYETKEDGKRTKVPIALRGGRASTTDPRDWGPFAAAYPTARRERLGLGFLLGGDGVVGVDLDRCVTWPIASPQGPHPERHLTDEARDIVTALYSYTEVSPSGRGVHILCRGALPPGRRGWGGNGMYDRGRFLCMTGWRVEHTWHALTNRTAELAELHARLFPPVRAKLVQARLGSGLTPEQVIEKASVAVNAGKFLALMAGDDLDYPSTSEADLAFAAMIAFYNDDPAVVRAVFDRSRRTRPKWRERERYRERTIDKGSDVREHWAGTTPGDVVLGRRKGDGGGT